MSTVLKIGPADHGRPMTREEFETGDYQEGYQYELIEGKLYVSPVPNQPENRVEEWIGIKLVLYALSHPTVINHVSAKARVFVPGHAGMTVPEPDRAAYHGFPLELPFEEVQWEDVSPVLVVEVLSSEDPDKDLVRNAILYFLVPSIKEYWVLDARDNPNQPQLKVHRRYGKKWRIFDVGYGETYTTKLLPDFKLLVDPRK
jgi:Uma2 family endonuclease